MRLLSRGSASASPTKTRRPAAACATTPSSGSIFCAVRRRFSSSRRTSTVTISGWPPSSRARDCAQHLRKHGHLEGAGGVGQLDKGEAVAARRGALLLADDDAGEAEAGGRRWPPAPPADRPSAGCRRVRGSCRRGRADGSTGRSRSRRTRSAIARPAASRRRPAGTGAPQSLGDRSPANRLSCRLSRSSAARLAWRSSSSAAAKLCARFGLRPSKAPALTRLSNCRRLKLLASSRRAKSNRSLKRPCARARRRGRASPGRRPP